MFEGLEFWALAWCIVALIAGGTIKGATGIGTPLLTIPMMTLVIPAQTAILIMVMPIVVANLWQFLQSSAEDRVVARFWPAFVAVLASTWVGVNILATIDERNLMIVVGVVVILFSLVQGSPRKFLLPEVWVKPAGAVFGIASGLIGGLSSMFGPPLILYLISVRGLSKNQFVSSISFVYISAVVPWAFMLYVVGVLNNHLLVLSLLAVIPVVVGQYFGQQLRARISEDRFKLLVIIILVMSGSSMLWKGLG